MASFCVVPTRGSSTPPGSCAARRRHQLGQAWLEMSAIGADSTGSAMWSCSRIRPAPTRARGGGQGLTPWERPMRAARRRCQTLSCCAREQQQPLIDPAHLELARGRAEPPVQKRQHAPRTKRQACERCRMSIEPTWTARRRSPAWSGARAAAGWGLRLLRAAHRPRGGRHAAWGGGEARRGRAGRGPRPL